MFKLFFLGLIDVSSLEINLGLLKQDKKYPKLNWLTVTTYHKLFRSKKRRKKCQT